MFDGGRVRTRSLPAATSWFLARTRAPIPALSMNVILWRSMTTVEPARATSQSANPPPVRRSNSPSRVTIWTSPRSITIRDRFDGIELIDPLVLTRQRNLRTPCSWERSSDFLLPHSGTSKNTSAARNTMASAGTNVLHPRLLRKRMEPQPGSAGPRSTSIGNRGNRGNPLQVRTRGSTVRTGIGSNSEETRLAERMRFS